MSRNYDTTNHFLQYRHSWTFGLLLGIVFAGIPLVGFAQRSVESARADSFIRMDGDRIFMRFRGEVVRPAGCPDSPIYVQARIQDRVKVDMEGDRFEFDVELISGVKPGLRLLAVSSDKKWMGAKTIGQFEFRQAAIDGIVLELEPVRQIDIRVSDQGKVVDGANVIVEGAFGFNIETKTNNSGVASVTVPESSEIYDVSAWTDDFRIGGYSLRRTPIRDPFASELQIDLSPCRRQRVRSVDANGEPIADLRIKLEVATKPPHFNYVPRYDRRELTTGANGEVEDLWFPDWEQFHFYVESMDPNWFVAKEATIEDGVLVAHFDKSPKRKRVNGRLKISSSMEGGFFIRLGSFEHPEESRYDLIFARTDVEGRFHLDVLPGATYCIFVDDTKWTSNYWTGILVDAESREVNEPLLKLSRGPKIEFQVTQGPEKSPVPNVSIHVGSSHRFTWMENGQESSGSLGPRKWVTTDKNGFAELRGPLGKMKAYVSLSFWRPEIEAEIVTGEVNRFEFHNPFLNPRKVAGRLSAVGIDEINLTQAEVSAFVFDGQTIDQTTTTTNDQGEFAGTIRGARIGVFARTEDAKAAGFVFVDNPDESFEVPLNPTVSLAGKLVDAQETPIASAKLVLVATLQDRQSGNGMVRSRYDVLTIDTVTNTQGEFQFEGVPVDLKFDVKQISESKPNGQVIHRGQFAKDAVPKFEVLRAR